MNHGTFPGIANHGSVDGHFAPLGGVVLFPGWAPELVTIEDAVYLRSGSWVRATDTLLPSDSPWITKDGDSLRLVPDSGSQSLFYGVAGFAGFDGLMNRQDENGYALIARGIMTTVGAALLLTDVRDGIVQPSVEVTVGISNNYTNINTAFGFYIPGRPFVTVHGTDAATGAAVSRLEEINMNYPAAVRRHTANRPTAFMHGARAVATSHNANMHSILVPSDGANEVLLVNSNTPDAWSLQIGPPAPFGHIGRAHAKHNMFVVADFVNPFVATSPTAQTGTWTMRAVPDVTGGIADCYFTASGALLALSHSGRVYRSTDDGATWTLLFTDTLARTFAFDHFSRRILLVTSRLSPWHHRGTRGIIYFSHDDGITWQSYDAGLNVIAPNQPELYPLVQLHTIRGSPQETAWRLRGGVVGTPEVSTVGGLVNYIRIR